MLTLSLSTPSHGDVTRKSVQGPHGRRNIIIDDDDEDFFNKNRDENQQSYSSSSSKTIVSTTTLIDERSKKEVVVLMREKLTLLLRDESNYYYLSTQSLCSADNSLHRLMFSLMTAKIGWDEKRFNKVIQVVAKAMSRLALFGQPITPTTISSNHKTDPLTALSCMALSKAGHRMPITTIAGPGGRWLHPFSEISIQQWSEKLEQQEKFNYQRPPASQGRIGYMVYVGYSVPVDDFREHRKFTRWVESNPFNHNWVTTALLELHYIEHIETYNRVRREAEDNFVLKKEHIERVIHNYGRGWYDAENTVTITEIQSLDLFMNYKQHAVSVSFIDDYHLLMTTCIQQRAHNWNEVNALQAAIIADDLHQVRLLIELGWDTHTEISNEFIKSPEMRTLLEEHFELPLEASHASTIGNSVVAQVWGLYEEDYYYGKPWIDYYSDYGYCTMEEVD